MLEIQPSSGHILQGTHIEKPVLRFRVDWESARRIVASCKEDPVVWPACKRHAFMLAETEDGAIKIAKYHHGLNGTNFVASRVEKFR